MLLISCCFFLSSCASSDVTRHAAAGVDTGVQNGKNLVEAMSSGDIAETYQNASQTSKGALLGGVTGAVAGALSSSVGVLPGTAVGVILGATYGAYVDANASIEDQLKNRGATIVVLGDQILIVLPSDRLFNPVTADIKPQAYSTLELVTNYINQYTKMLVKIAAYTNDMGPKEVDLALSRQQAQAVSKFLMAAGVDARVLYAAGYGGADLGGKKEVEWEGHDKYRIEITLEKLLV